MLLKLELFIVYSCKYSVDCCCYFIFVKILDVDSVFTQFVRYGLKVLHCHNVCNC